MERRTIAAAGAVTAAVVAAATFVMASGDSDQSAPTSTLPARVMLFEAVPAQRIDEVDVSESCRQFLAPLRDMMNEAVYPSEVNTNEWASLAPAQADAACELDEIADFQLIEVQQWASRIGPVYDSDIPSALSTSCAAALTPARDKLDTVDVERAAITDLLSAAVSDGTADAGPLPESLRPTPDIADAPTSKAPDASPTKRADAMPSPSTISSSVGSSDTSSLSIPPAVEGTTAPVSVPACSQAEVQAFTQREFLPALRRAGLETRGTPTAAWDAFDAAHASASDALTPGRGSAPPVARPAQMSDDCASAYETAAATVAEVGYATAYDTVVASLRSACDPDVVEDFVASAASGAVLPGAQEPDASLRSTLAEPDQTIPAPSPPAAPRP